MEVFILIAIFTIMSGLGVPLGDDSFKKTDKIQIEQQKDKKIEKGKIK